MSISMPASPHIHSYLRMRDSDLIALQIILILEGPGSQTACFRRKMLLQWINLLTGSILSCHFFCIVSFLSLDLTGIFVKWILISARLLWKKKKRPQERIASLFIPVCEKVSEPQGQNLSNQSVCLLEPLPHIPRNPNPASLLTWIWPALHDKAHKDSGRNWEGFILNEVSRSWKHS